MNSNAFEKRILGRSGLEVGPLGLASSYGAPAKSFEKAFDQGCNYFYWGSARREGMGKAIRNLAPQHRQKLVIVLQSYSRLGTVLNLTTKKGLRDLKIDYADVLLLGWYNQLPSNRVLDAAMKLKEAGLIRHLAISCHHRPSFKTYIEDTRFDIIMTRYNAAHRGAEREVFPLLKTVPNPPGVVSYTATRWGYLINPKYTPPGVPTPKAADCYRFALSNPSVHICLTGPASEAQMDENLKALEKGPLSADEMNWMKAVGDYVHQRTSKKFTNPFMQRQQ